LGFVWSENYPEKRLFFVLFGNLPLSGESSFCLMNIRAIDLFGLFPSPLAKHMTNEYLEELATIKNQNIGLQETQTFMFLKIFSIFIRTPRKIST
jgi:hypothetical protein